MFDWRTVIRSQGRAAATPKRGFYAAAIVVALAILLPIPASAYISTGPASDRAWHWQNPVPQGNTLVSAAWVGEALGWAVGPGGMALSTQDGGATWAVQNTGSSRDLTSVDFKDASNGWIVGLSGTVLRTANGGGTWSAQTVPAAQAGRNLRAVSFADANVGVAVGDLGATTSTILYTANGGATWRASTTTCTVALSAVSMVSTSTGWAVGGAGNVLKTSDGGATWSVQRQFPNAAGLSSVSFEPSGTVGYIVGNAALPDWTIYKTADSGTTWTAVSGLGVTGAVNLFHVDCLDANNAIAVGSNGAIRHTTDGGATWANQSVSSIGSNGLRDVRLVTATRIKTVGDVGAFFTTRDGGSSWSSLMPGTTQLLRATWFSDANHGWAVGDNGVAMSTSDAGTTWLTQQVGQGSWRGVHFADNTNGWAVGDAGAIMHTADGVTWQRQSSGSGQQLSGVWFVSPTTGYVVGSGSTILKTTDGGNSWAPKSATTATTTPGTIDAVWFASETTGYFVNTSSYIYKTTDGGNTWTRTASGAGQILNAIRGTDASTVWAAGNGGAIVKTTDGGAHWTAQPSGAGSQPIRAIAFSDANTGWFGSTYGLVKRTVDGGSTWTTQSAGMPADSSAGVYGISFADANTGYLVGDTGTIRRTLDGGATWTSLQFGTLNTMNEVVFPDAQNGFACGAGGVVLHSSDGGQSWAQQKSGVGSNLRSMQMADALHGWAVGDGGVIRNTIDGGSTWAPQNSRTTNGLLGVSTLTTQTAIAVGAAGTILYTTDGGTTWSTPTAIPTSQQINAVSVVSSTTAFATATYSAGSPNVIKTTDGGVTWTAVTVPTATSSLYSVAFLSAPNHLVGFITGDSGIVLKTIDGGATWTRQTTPVTAQLRGVSFADLTTGWAVGAAGTVLRTVNGGSTWTLQPPGTTLGLSSVAYSDASRAWIVGSNGLLLRSTDIAPPATTVTLTPASPNGANGWYTTAPLVTLLADKPAVSYYGWASAGGPFSVYLPPLLATEGARTLYCYSVDASGNAESVRSLPVRTDLTSPTAPANVAVDTIAASSAHLSWAAATDALSGVAYYRVFSGATLVATTTATSMGLTSLAPATAYTYYVRAVDAAGNESTSGAGVSFTTDGASATPLVTTALPTPLDPDGANGWYVSAAPSVALSVEPSTVAAWTYYSLEPTPSTWTTYTAPISAPPGSSTLSYYSVDQAGLRTPETARAIALKYDPQTPSATTSMTAFAITANGVHLAWDPVASTPSGIAEYAVYQGGLLLARTPDTTYDVLGLRPVTGYSYTVAAINGAGTTGTVSASAEATTPGAALPAAPGVMVARAPVGEYAYVDWTASVDAQNPVTYRIWRSGDGSAYSAVATLTGGDTSYIDTGLRSSTRYYYAVSTVDSRGESVLTSTAPSTWGFTAPTTAKAVRPAGIAAVDGSGTVLVSWLPDANPAVVGYVVTRGARSLATDAATVTPVPLAATSFTDTSAVNGQTYYYAVSGVDASGVVGFSSLEIESKPHAAYPGPDPHIILADGNGAACAACHAGHISPAPGSPHGMGLHWRVDGPNQDSLCLSCHSVNSGLASTDTSSALGDPLNRSAIPMWTASNPDPRNTCDSCHRAITTTATPVAALMAVGGSGGMMKGGATIQGNAICYSCHGPTTTLRFGDLSGFESASMNTSAIPDPPSGSKIKCEVCHESHTSRNLRLTKYAGFMQCMQCHTSSSVIAPDVWTRLQLNSDPDAKLPIMPDDRVLGGQASCENCHNVHTVTNSYKLVDPYNPGPTGLWTASQTGNLKDYCFTCHNNQSRPLPRSQDTSPWADPVYSRATSASPVHGTTVTNIQLAYQTNVHGFGTSANPAAQSWLRPDMGYLVGDVIDCGTCHDAHGTPNNYELRGDVKSASGGKSASGLLVYKIPAGSVTPTSAAGYDTRFWCAACHVLTKASHDAAAGPGGPDLDQFPIDCNACHRHMNADGTPSTLH